MCKRDEESTAVGQSALREGDGDMVMLGPLLTFVPS